MVATAGGGYRLAMMAPSLAKTAQRILVADDDPVILRLLQVNLGLEGFDVETAADGEEALGKTREILPDLVVLDVMMPVLDGWEVARRLAEDGATSKIPVVLLTARTQREDVERGRDLRVAAYVTKPFDPSELVATIRRLGSARS